MKKQPLKLIYLALTIFFTLPSTNNALAHDIAGALGNDRSAMDVYQVHCYDDGAGPNDHLIVSVKDINPMAKPLVSIQVSSSTRVLNTTDEIDGDSISSPKVKLKGNGSGDDYYLISIDKTDAGNEIYTVEYHCETFHNQHTGTNTALIINQ